MKTVGAVALWLTLTVCLPDGLTHAQITQPTGMLASGSTTASGPGYMAWGTLGQPTFGLTSAPQYTNGIGFWYRVYGLSGSSTLVIYAHIKAFLQGPYNTTTNLMDTAFLAGGFLPTTQPYAEAAFDGTPMDYDGNENVAPLPGTAVDWVLLELRTSPSAADSIDTRAALMLNTGLIVDLDGTSPVAFSGLADGTYYLVVRHRNYLPVMTTSAITLNANPTLYDFTTSQNQAFGTNATTLLEPGVYGLFAGDADGNGLIQNSDKNLYWAPQAGLSGYHSGDFNLNALVQNDDKNVLWAPNAGLSTQFDETSVPFVLPQLSNSHNDAGLTFTFGQGTIEKDGSVYAFDVMVEASKKGTELGDTQVFLGYNPAVFGEYVAARGRITVKKGAFVANNVFYDNPSAPLVVNDTGPAQVAITMPFAGIYGTGKKVKTKPKALLRVSLTLNPPLQPPGIHLDEQPPSQSVGLRFAEALMVEQQFEADNATTYRHITAIDTDDTIPVLPGAQEYAGRLADFEVRHAKTTELPGPFVVEAAYPNPFTLQAQFRFAVREQQRVTAELFDMQGRRVAMLYRGLAPAHRMETVRIDGSGLANGLYLIRIQGSHFIETQPLIRIK